MRNLLLTKKTIRKKGILLMAFLFVYQYTFSCTCINPPTYCETMQSESSNLLIVGYKINNFYHGMSIKIVQILEGSESRDTITVWGDNGMLCRHYSGNFSINDTIVFALHNCDLNGNLLGGIGHEKIDHYQISNCGVYYLDYNNGHVFGSIDNAVNSLSLIDFQQLHLSCTSTSINIHSTKKTLIKIIDILGRQTEPIPNIPFFYIYSDGTIEKKVIIE